VAAKTLKTSGKGAKQGAKARSSAPPVRKSAAKTPKTAKKAAKPVARPVARKPAKPGAKPAAKPAGKKAGAAKPVGKKPVGGKSAPKPVARKAVAAKPVAKKSSPVKAQPKARPQVKATAKAVAKPKAPEVRSTRTAPVAPATPVAPLAPVAPRHPQRSDAAAAGAGKAKPVVFVQAASASPAARVLAPAKALPAAKRPFSRESVRVGESKHAQPAGARPVFPAEFLERQRERLRVKKLEILAMYQKDLKSGQESNDSPTEDLVDRANNAYTRELAFSISDSERELMHQIDLAIERLKTGSYGFCLHTGQQIGQARLEAIPWAKYSVEAQELLEKGLLSEA